MTYWWLGTEDLYPVAAAPESVIKDLRVWHVFNKGIFHYPANRVTIDGLVIRGKDPASAACCGQGILIGDYMARYFVLRNADIQGMTVGIEVGSFTDTASAATAAQAYTAELIEDSKFIGNIVAIDVPTVYTSAFHSGSIPPRQIVVRNVKFDSAPLPGQTTIRMRYMTDGARNVMQRDEVFVYGYNQVAGDDFRLYYPEQRSDFVLPATIWYDDTQQYAILTGSPAPGMTNQQVWNTYGRAIAGNVAPCTSTRAAVAGLVCAMTGTPDGLNGSILPPTIVLVPPTAPTNLRIR
jgi:hypothetical protein